MKKFALLIAIAALAPHIASANLIVNGDFSSGNTGFSSDYFYTPVNTAAGEYYVQSGSASSWNAGFLNVVGYGGSGNYLIANGATSTAQSPWYQTLDSPSLTLTTDTNNPVYYRFEAQLVNLVPSPNAPPDLAFEISVNGGTWNTFTATPVMSPGAWTLTYVDTYITTAPTSLGFRLRNQATEYNGNDFAVDSIYFGLTTEASSYPAKGILSAGDIANPTFVEPVSTVPEPGTWAAAALLAGGAGFMRWRKRAKVA